MITKVKSEFKLSKSDLGKFVYSISDLDIDHLRHHITDNNS
jgi:hypothetical protein